MKESEESENVFQTCGEGVWYEGPVQPEEGQVPASPTMAAMLPRYLENVVLPPSPTHAELQALESEVEENQKTKILIQVRPAESIRQKELPGFPKEQALPIFE